MAESLTGMAEALRWKSLAGKSQDKYKGHWAQWQQWCQMMEMPVVLPHKELPTNTLQLGAFAVFLFYIVGIPGNVATNMERSRARSRLSGGIIG